MPLYTMRNTKTGEVEDKMLRIAEMQDLVASGEWEQIIGGAALITHTGNMINKTPDSWKSHLKDIKKKAGKQVANTIKL